MKMEQVGISNKRLKTAHDDIERDYKAQIDKLDCKERELLERFNALDKEKRETAESNGNVDAAEDDIVEINAGGKVIAAKRSTLTRLKGTRLEALFSGRWDNKLQRDSNERIFLDVNPVCFQAIVDYLNELAISSEDNPPARPSVDKEHEHILGHQLGLFGLCDDLVQTLDSNIIMDKKHATKLHEWLKEGGSDGKFNLLYRSSSDGLSAKSFHSKCDNKGCTISIIETTGGLVLGGYSNTPWKSPSGNEWAAADKAFLFVMSGGDISSPYKMKFTDSDNSKAVYHNSSFGPAFGGGCDLKVKGSELHLFIGCSYESGPPGLIIGDGAHAIKEIEAFQVIEKSSGATNENRTQREVAQVEPVSTFSESVNEAINAKQESLLQAELEVLHLEDCFKDEADFVTSFAGGDTKDIVTLNVSGTIMVTRRSTLCTAEDSVLAQQFDDTKWTEQGCNNIQVKKWTPDDVGTWADNIECIQDGIGSILKEHGINGGELLALDREGLKMIGIERAGTLCLLLEEIKMLKQASSDVVTLIEHSPYCFGKILDYLRLKQLHSQGLVEEPALPAVCDSQQSRFEKVVKYYFPGDSAKFILG